MNDDALQKISKLLDKKLVDSENRLDKKLSALENRLDEKLAVSEKRSDKKLVALEKRLKKHTTDSIKQLSSDVGDFMQENLFPMIEEKADKSDIDRLERKLDRVLDSSVDHESRIKAIEQIPAIAHELKLKKFK